MHFRTYYELENNGASIPVEERKSLLYKKKYVLKRKTFHDACISEDRAIFDRKFIFLSK